MSLRRNFSWMAIGRGIYALCQWSVLAILARFGTSEMLGEYTYALAVISPIVIFSQLNLRGYMATDAKDKFAISDYVATRIVTTIFAVIAIALVSIFINKNSTEAMKLMVMVAAYKSVESISDIYYGVFQKYEVMSKIAFSVVIRSIFSLISMAFFVLTYKNVIFGAASIAICWLLILLIYDMPVSRVNIKSVINANLGVSKNIIFACLPLGIVAILGSLRLNIPVYFIKMYHGIEAVGNFSVVSYFLVAGTLIITSLSQSAAPKLARTYHSEDLRDFYLVLSKLILFAFIVGIIGVLIALVFGKQILLLLYGDSFSDSWNLLVWMMVAGLIGYLAQFFGVALTVARKFKLQLYSNILGLLVILAISLYLIPTMGELGGVVAIIGVNLTRLICNSLFLWSVFTMKNNSN